MLCELHIKNYALIRDLRLQFSKGLNVITGETGAGKSIIIGALGQILGERANAEAIRKGADKYRIEGSFELDEEHPILRKLREFGIESEEGQLTLKREVSSEGRGRCYVNETPVTVKTLRTVGDLLVDIHGQHQHQSLLRPETHVDFLDSFEGLDEKVKELSQKYNDLIQLQKKLKRLKDQKAEAEERKELYTFQLEEISNAWPDIENVENLERERKVLENKEKLLENISSLYNMLYGSEDSVFDRLGTGARLLEDSSKMDEELAKRTEDYNSAFYGIEEFALFLRDYSEKLEANPQKLEEIQEKLANIDRLKRKYGGDIQSILERKEFLEEQLKSSENLNEEIEKVGNELLLVSTKLSKLCEDVSGKRKEGAKRLKSKIEGSLKDLGMPDADFEVLLDQRKDPEGAVEIDGERFDVGPKGIEQVEFYMSTNPGEDRKNLVKVASGGEISRIMLSLKSILADADAIPILIFDEIDIGISGKTAEAVGRKLKGLSRSHQIISITHLPQIAKKATRHISVFKEQKENRTITKAITLDENQRIREMAKLLGGEVISQTTLQNARELLEKEKESVE